MFLNIFIASIIGSFVALIGGLLLLWKEKYMQKISLIFVSFATGSLLGAAFFDLLPEALDKSENTVFIFSFVIAGILMLFLLEKFLKWYHCHNKGVCEYHTFSSAMLFGDAIHNFIDGIVIAFSFGLGANIGIATTLAVFFHEIPQEMGDFGVLLHARWEKKKIILVNFATALTTILGGILGYIALPFLSSFLPYLVSFAAGTFIYIAVSDLMPELRHESKPKEFIHFFIIILGIMTIFSIGLFFEH